MSELVDQLHDCQVCSVAQNYCRNHVLIQRAAARIEELEAALRDIAAFDDIQASRHFDNTGSFALFDEPGSVQIARRVLCKQEDK